MKHIDKRILFGCFSLSVLAFTFTSYAAEVKVTNKVGVGVVLPFVPASATFVFHPTQSKKAVIEIVKGNKVVGSTKIDVLADTDYEIHESLSVDDKNKLRITLSVFNGQNKIGGDAFVDMQLVSDQKAFFVGSNFAGFDVPHDKSLVLSDVLFFGTSNLSEWCVRISTNQAGRNVLLFSDGTKPKYSGDNLTITLAAN